MYQLQQYLNYTNYNCNCFVLNKGKRGLEYFSFTVIIPGPVKKSSFKYEIQDSLGRFE